MINEGAPSLMVLLPWPVRGGAGEWCTFFGYFASLEFGFERVRVWNGFWRRTVGLREKGILILNSKCSTSGIGGKFLFNKSNR